MTTITSKGIIEFFTWTYNEKFLEVIGVPMSVNVTEVLHCDINDDGTMAIVYVRERIRYTNSKESKYLRYCLYFFYVQDGEIRARDLMNINGWSIRDEELFVDFIVTDGSTLEIPLDDYIKK